MNLPITLRGMAILILDNFDSFTYNLLHYLEQVSQEECVVVRNNAISVDEVANYQRIVISPGPGLPVDAGITMELIRRFFNAKPILGVCLGHQALGEFFGGKLINLDEVQHGVASEIECSGEDLLFKGLPQKMLVGRYHSWIVDDMTLNPEMRVTARDENGHVMAMKHVTLPLHGVQFHPESIMTEYGLEMMKNWLSIPL